MEECEREMFILDRHVAFRVPKGKSKERAKERWKLRPLVQISSEDMSRLRWTPGSLAIVYLTAGKRTEEEEKFSGKTVDGGDIKDKIIGVAEIWPSQRVKSREIRLSDHFCLGARGGSVSASSRIALRIFESPTGARERPSLHIPAATSVDIVLRPKAMAPLSHLRGSDFVSSYVTDMLRRRCPYVVRGCRMSLSVAGATCSITVSEIRSSAPIATDIEDEVRGLYRLTRATAIQLLWKTVGEDEETTETPAAKAKEERIDVVGGLEKEMREVTEIIDAPLKSPEIFSRHGISAPKGVLMYGPPGTGKTLIARVVARRCRASFHVLNGPDVVGRWVGDSERTLRRRFDEASAKAPSIIFIDEIDAIAPKRGRRSANEFDKRLVSALLAAIDSLPPRVVVLAATNRRHTLDPSLRRPGRIDREVEIPVPSRAGRLDILRVLFDSMKQRVPQSVLAAAADRTHGCVGADLRSLCRYAGIRALRRELETARSDAIVTARIVAADVEAAVRVTKPSALREIAVEVPCVRWADIGGQSEIKQQVRETVEWPLRHADAFARIGIEPPRGVLLYGPPGCAKTMMAKAMATESAMNFVAVKGPELFSKWVGESERAIQELFAKARRSAPTIVFFDEIDAIAVQRGSDGGGGASVADRVLSQLLQEIDGIEPSRRVVVVAATNRPDVIDPALLRPGRLDRLLYVAPPDSEARSEILRIHLRKTPCDAGLDIGRLAKVTSGYSGAELAALCREAALFAMQEDMRAKLVCSRHFDAALKAVKPQITEKMLRFYETFSGHGSRSAGFA